MDDYFAGSLAPRQPAPAAPPYPQGPQPSYPQSPFQPTPVEPPPFARPGWAPPAGTAPSAWGAAPAAPQPSGNRTLLVGIGVVVAVVVLLVAGVAGRNVMEQRSIARRTTVSLPPAVLGMPHLTDATAVQAESLAERFPGPGDVVVGVYGAGAERVVVIAAKYPMGSKGKKEFLAGAEDSVQGQGLSFTDVRPGRLGGTLRCAQQAAMTVCVFLDAGSYGAVLVAGGTAPTDTARAVREAVVHRS